MEERFRSAVIFISQSLYLYQSVYDVVDAEFNPSNVNVETRIFRLLCTTVYVSITNLQCSRLIYRFYSSVNNRVRARIYVFEITGADFSILSRSFFCSGSIYKINMPQKALF